MRILQGVILTASNYDWIISATRQDSELKIVQIYFDTATYDVVEKDQKVMFWLI